MYPPLPLAPVIEQPPFEDRLLVEVVVDTCLKSSRGAVADRHDPHLPTERRRRRDGRLPDLLDTYPHRRRPRGLGERGVPALALRRRAAQEGGGSRHDRCRVGDLAGFVYDGRRGGPPRRLRADRGPARRSAGTRTTPSEVEALPGRYIAIDAAEGTTCAVTEDGEAVCWGSDRIGLGSPAGPLHDDQHHQRLHLCADRGRRGGVLGEPQRACPRAAGSGGRCRGELAVGVDARSPFGQVCRDHRGALVLRRRKPSVRLRRQSEWWLRLLAIQRKVPAVRAAGIVAGGRRRGGRPGCGRLLCGERLRRSPLRVERGPLRGDQHGP